MARTLSIELQKRAHSLKLAAGLASESKNGTLPYGGRFPAACCRELQYEGAFYHITARGNEGEKIYFARSDYEKLKACLKAAQEKFGLVLHCYVLMTNHHHLLRDPSWQREQGDALR